MFGSLVIVDDVPGEFAERVIEAFHSRPNDTFSVGIAILVTDATHGTLTLNNDGSFAYTSAVGFNGVDTFTYHIFDAAIGLSSAIATVTLGPAGRPMLAFCETLSQIMFRFRKPR